MNNDFGLVSMKEHNRLKRRVERLEAAVEVLLQCYSEDDSGPRYGSSSDGTESD